MTNTVEANTRVIEEALRIAMGGDIKQNMRRVLSNQIRRPAYKYNRERHLWSILRRGYWYMDAEDKSAAIIGQLKALIRDNRRRPRKSNLRLQSLWFALAGEYIMAGRYVRNYARSL